MEAIEAIQAISELTDTNVKRGAIEKFLEELPDKALAFGIKVLLCLLAFWIGTRIITFILKILQKSMEKAGADKGVRSFVNSFLKAAMYVILIFILLSSFGIDTASVVALVGSAGVAIGLAVQGSLSNLAGGVLILLAKPFKVGDYIKEDGHGNEGFVTEIQIFYTKLLTVDHRIVILPNGDLANCSLTNVSAHETRRLDIQVGIAYEADLKKAKEVLTALLMADDKILKQPDPFVFVDSLGDSAVTLNMRFYVKQADYWDTKWRITEECKLTLDTEGISIPFNQLDVHMIPLEK